MLIKTTPAVHSGATDSDQCDVVQIPSIMPLDRGTSFLLGLFAGPVDLLLQHVNLPCHAHEDLLLELHAHVGLFLKIHQVAIHLSQPCIKSHQVFPTKYSAVSWVSAGQCHTVPNVHMV